jgi:hypothetical protein
MLSFLHNFFLIRGIRVARFLLYWFCFTNLKTIGTLYLISSASSRVQGIIVVFLIRLELAHPGNVLLSGNHQMYNYKTTEQSKQQEINDLSSKTEQSNRKEINGNDTSTIKKSDIPLFPSSIIPTSTQKMNPDYPWRLKFRLYFDKVCFWIFEKNVDVLNQVTEYPDYYLYAFNKYKKKNSLRG